MSRNTNKREKLDWITILLYLIMVAGGWFCIYSVSYNFGGENSIFDFSNRAGKQLVWIGTAFFIAFLLILIDYRFYKFISYLSYFFIILLLLLTIFIAPDIKGSRSWLVFGPISLQPAEFAKFATALALAKGIEEVKKNYNLRNLILLGLIVFLPFALIVLQKEMGTALVFSVFFLVFYREGMSGFVLLSGLFFVILFILVVRFGELSMFGLEGDLGLILSFLGILLVNFFILFYFVKNKKEALFFLGGVLLLLLIAYILDFWIKIDYSYVLLLAIFLSSVFLLVKALQRRQKAYKFLFLFSIVAVIFCFASNSFFYSVLKPHQQTRIKIVLNMESDLSGAGYNVNQSKIAIGSGGLKGKGFLNGTQTKLNFVPEQDTDFIFCTIGEEFGFIGTVSFLIIYLLFLLRLLYIAERQRDVFSRVYGYCVVCIFFFHMFVNVGMVVGLMPVIGIPLPFFSYGGSSLWAFTILLFILIRLDSARLLRVN